MIKNIILDFGDVLINLDKPATARAMLPYGFSGVTPSLDSLFKDYEKGLLASSEFLDEVSTHFPDGDITVVCKLSYPFALGKLIQSLNLSGFG